MDKIKFSDYRKVMMKKQSSQQGKNQTMKKYYETINKQI